MRRDLASLVLVLILIPEPVTTVLGVMLVCLWCLLGRRGGQGLGVQAVAGAAEG